MTLLHLAQITPASNPEQVGTWVLIALGLMGGLIMLINGVLNIVRAIWPAKPGPIEPQPLIVQLAERFTPIEEHHALKNKVESHQAVVAHSLQELDRQRRESVSRVYEKTEERIDQIRGEIRHDIEGIYDRLDKHGETLGEIRGELRHIRHQKSDA